MRTVSVVADDVKWVCKAHGRLWVTGKEQPLRTPEQGGPKRPIHASWKLADTLFKKHRKEEGVSWCFA